MLTFLHFIVIMRLTLALSFRRFRERFYAKNAKIFWRTHGKKMFVRELRLTDEVSCVLFFD